MIHVEVRRLHWLRHKLNVPVSRSPHFGVSSEPLPCGGLAPSGFTTTLPDFSPGIFSLMDGSSSCSSYHSCWNSVSNGDVGRVLFDLSVANRSRWRLLHGRFLPNSDLTDKVAGGF